MILAILAASAAVTASGQVTIELTVSAEGSVTHCTVVESSAPPEVAEQACRVSMARMQRAARDDAGAPVESKRLVTVRYQPRIDTGAG
jgi:TonB family protein